MAEDFDFTIKTGVTFEPLVFTYVRAGVDFSGWTPRLQARSMAASKVIILDETPTLVATTDTATMTLHLTSAVTLPLPLGQFPYALTLVHPEDEPIIPVVGGLITIISGIVR